MKHTRFSLAQKTVWALLLTVLSLAAVPHVSAEDCPLCGAAVASEWDEYTQDRAEDCPLCIAAIAGNVAYVNKLIAEGADVNATSNDYFAAPLGLAYEFDNLDAAELLLANGAYVNVKAAFSAGTRLYKAVSDNKKEFVKLFITHGADVNAIEHVYGGTALHETARGNSKETAKLLLANGADIHAKDRWDMTALHWAVYQNAKETAALLIAHGADPDLADKRGRTVWNMAADKPLMKAILDKAIAKKYGVDVQSAQTPDSPAKTVFENTWRSIVVIKIGGKQGSGVIVRPNIVATNCHVLDGGKITVYKHDNRRASTDTLFAATVRKRDSANDFCLLDVSGLGGVPAKIRKYDTLKIGETVYALGSPKGLDLSLSSGLISQLRQGGGGGIIQTDAAISPGSSGGGLFDSAGNLIGITTLIHKDADAANIGFAIPADLALNL